MSYPNEEFDMEEHKAYMKRAAKKRKRDWDHRKKYAKEENEELRHTYIRRAKAAREIHEFQEAIPKPTWRVRARWWLGQLIPRTHWGIYMADGRRRLVIWKTWLGKATKEIDVKIG